MAGLTIIDPGVLTTVQDEGRTGYMDSGFSPSGALDNFSFRLANFLAGNVCGPPGEAALEMTLRGASLVFDGPAVIALTGADMKPLLNGFPAAMNKACAVAAGDILFTGFAVSGTRSYLAVSGGFDLPPVLGSRSTNLKAQMGGFKGRKLASGDYLPFRKTIHTLPDLERRFFNPAAVHTAAETLTLRVVEGKQAAYFTAAGLRTFYGSVYTVGAESDRMGVRLEGPAVASVGGTDIVSDGIAPGAVQVPGSGKPIVLLNDRQTTGGYAKIGAVVSSDLRYLAQAPAGQQIRFEKITPAAAEKLYIRTEKETARLGQYFFGKDR